MNVRFSVSIDDKTQEILLKTRAACERALEIIGGKAESYAKDMTPVRTGALRNSFGHIVDGSSVTIGSNIHYAPYVEFGTGNLYEPAPEWMEFNAKRGRGLDRWFYKDDQGNWHVGYPRAGVHMLQKAIADHIGEYNSIIKSELTIR